MSTLKNATQILGNAVWAIVSAPFRLIGFIFGKSVEIAKNVKKFLFATPEKNNEKNATPLSMRKASVVSSKKASSTPNKTNHHFFKKEPETLNKKQGTPNTITDISSTEDDSVEFKVSYDDFTNCYDFLSGSFSSYIISAFSTIVNFYNIFYLYISLESAKKWLQDQSYDISLFKKNDPAQKLYLEVLNLSLEDINRAASGGEEALNTLFEKAYKNRINYRERKIRNAKDLIQEIKGFRDKLKKEFTKLNLNPSSPVSGPPIKMMKNNIAIAKSLQSKYEKESTELFLHQWGSYLHDRISMYKSDLTIHENICNGVKHST